ncbi:MAG: aminodeoxychorismate/anthranilate synthase component II [Deltaproteobacteria bacterium]|nr:aminodeoxychorismate/anthranilate synthase component II [Deltaproteobacteria bacterium]
MLLIIDNYDSFIYPNIRVIKNDEMGVSEIQQLHPSYLVISPGPGLPQNAGMSLEVIRAFAGHIPILGVCLGHQALAQVFGAKLSLAPHIFHGKTSWISHDGKGIFKDVQSPLEVMRYHSWIVDGDQVSSDFEISAYTADRVPMALRHSSYPIEGVQFHPESILTSEGKKLLKNFLAYGNHSCH